jgi:hypothetical protein
MQVEKTPLSVNTMNLQQPKVLVRPHQAESTKEKNVVVGDERHTLQGKTLTREVTCETSPDGRKTLKITVKPFGSGGGKSRLQHPSHSCSDFLRSRRLNRLRQAV